MTITKRLFALFMTTALFSNYSFADTTPPVIDADREAVNAVNATSDPAEDQTVSINENLKIIAVKKHEENAELAYEIDANYPQLVGKDLTPADQQFNQIVLRQVNQRMNQFKNYVKADHVHMLTLPQAMQQNTLQIDYDLDVVHAEQYPLISVRLNIEGMQAGRPHPYHSHEVLNYDLTQNKELALSDLFKPHANFLSVIAKFCNKKLNSTLQDKWMITEGTASTPKNYKNWNIEADGILITFEEYQVAPYVYGPQEVEIPFDALKAILAPHSNVMPCVQGAYDCIKSDAK